MSFRPSMASEIARAARYLADKGLTRGERVVVVVEAGAPPPFDAVPRRLGTCGVELLEADGMAVACAMAGLDDLAARVLAPLPADAVAHVVSLGAYGAVVGALGADGTMARAARPA